MASSHINVTEMTKITLQATKQETKIPTKALTIGDNKSSNEIFKIPTKMLNDLLDIHLTISSQIKTGMSTETPIMTELLDNDSCCEIFIKMIEIRIRSIYKLKMSIKTEQSQVKKFQEVLMSALCLSDQITHTITKQEVQVKVILICSKQLIRTIKSRFAQTSSR